MSSALNHNIYRGLYPIREVKQYYRREFVNGKPLYICLWSDCGFKTWKYSQHIARHIHLKHIGIKELKCEEKECQKTFKRPESLVQHQKNHLCGFGIDSQKMKDPNNVCGVKNIKRYYFRELDNDYYVFGCKWNGCEFVTNNSGSIRRHVHNQHLCPHTANNTTATNGHSSDKSQNNTTLESLDTSYTSEQPLVQVIELDPQLLGPQLDETNDNQMEMIDHQMDVDREMETNPNRSSTGGLYSLKNYSELYSKVKIDGEMYFKCNCNRFTTKNQISLVRHIWTDIGRNDFECDVNGCNAKFDNENHLYRHKRNDHNYEPNSFGQNANNSVEQNGSFNSDIPELNPSSHLKTNDGLMNSPQTLISILNDNSLANSYASHESRSAHMKAVNQNQSQTGMYSLKNLSQYFTKTTVDNEMVYECNCKQFRTKSNVTLVRHIRSHNKVDCYECDLCSAQFNDEPSLYRHRIFDHNSNSTTNQSSPNLPIKPDLDNKNNIKKINLIEENMLSSDGVREDTNGNQSKQMGFKRSFGSDRNNSGLYSLKNYDKFYTKVKLNEEILYKCTVCGFASRSQVSLIRHIWSHTGRNTFECDVADCKERFNTETELYRHRKTHSSQSSQAFTTSTPIPYPPYTSNTHLFNYSVDNTGAEDMSSPTGDQMRKIMDSKTERGIYSLKNYENNYQKIKLEDGFQFVCNCGQFKTRSQATLVRHFWEHQTSHGITDQINSDFNELNNLSKISNDLEIESNIKAMDSENMDEELYEDLEEGVETSGDQNSELNPFFGINKSNEDLLMTEEDNDLNASEVSAEDWSRLIVSIEDRGYFCQWPDCEFSDECRDSVISHIKQMHTNESNVFMQTTNDCDNEFEDNYSDSDLTPEQNTSQTIAINDTEEFESLFEQQLRENKLIYICKATNCLFETALNSDIILHIKQNHLIESSFDGNCSSEADYSRGSQSDPNQFVCQFNYCNASFPSIESLVEHKKMHSKLNFINSDNFDDNIEDEMQQNFANNNIKPVKSWKTYSYNGKASALNAERYSDAIMQSDGTCLHVCKWKNCGYQSPVRGNIIRHIRRHTGDKPFICQLSGCGRGFAYSTEVKLHQQKDH